MKHIWNKPPKKGIVISFLIALLISQNNNYAVNPSNEGIQIYQKNGLLSPDHKQNFDTTDEQDNSSDNLWDILRQEFTLPHYEDNPRVQEQINWFMNHQDFLYHSAARAAPYLYYILQQVRKRNLPAEVALIPIFESSYNPFASSSVGAAGVWQLMPNTASSYGIKQNWWYDGRRDIVASTKAALNHLSYLSNFFDGNWLYAVAAYDTGEGNVLAAIKKNINYGYNTDFWSLPVAEETRVYIPKLLALATIISHPEAYPVQLPYVRNAPYLAQVDIGRQIDLKQAAYLAGLTYKNLKTLNPGYNHTSTDPNGPFKIILPIENVEQFTANLADSHLPPPLTKRILESQNAIQYATSNESRTIKIKTRMKNKLKQFIPQQILTHFHGHYTLQPGDTLYMVRAADTLEKIANHFHTTSDALRLANNIKQHQPLAVGDKLIIPTHLYSENSQKYSLAPGDTLYMVRKGDTIAKIAKKYHTNPSALRVANLMMNKEVKEGDALIIPTLS